jgi:hypothetical protein
MASPSTPRRLPWRRRTPHEHKSDRAGKIAHRGSFPRGRERAGERAPILPRGPPPSLQRGERERRKERRGRRERAADLGIRRRATGLRSASAIRAPACPPLLRPLVRPSTSALSSSPPVRLSASPNHPLLCRLLRASAPAPYVDLLRPLLRTSSPLLRPSAPPIRSGSAPLVRSAVRSFPFFVLSLCVVAMCSTGRLNVSCVLLWPTATFLYSHKPCATLLYY